MPVIKEKIVLYTIIFVLLLGVIVLGILLCLKQKELSQVKLASELSGMFGGVITESGDWQSPENPMPSGYLEEKEVPKGAIKIGISSENGFSPSSFEVKKGEKVVLSITALDDYTHVFSFRDEKLSKVAVGVSSNKTRAISFYAPEEPGEYEFICGVPGHANLRAEKGMMIVK